MKPPAFEYLRPTSLPDTLALLEQYQDDAKILAGGQSLVPMMNMRLVEPQALIDINQVPELSRIALKGDVLEIGAMVRHATLEKDALVRQHAPLLSEAEQWIAHTAIRTRGTIGGSLVHADPSAELPLAVLTLGGSLVLESQDGEREVSAEDFFITYLTTDRGPAELLTRIRIPVLPPSAGCAVQEFHRRHGDFAIVAAMAVLDLDASGRIGRCHAGVGGVGGTPVRLRSVEEALLGKAPDEALFQEVAAAAAEELAPDADLHASEAFRRQLAKTLLFRALTEAGERARDRQR